MTRNIGRAFNIMRKIVENLRRVRVGKTASSGLAERDRAG